MSAVRRCGRCNQVARRDDPLQTAQWEGAMGGTATAAVCRSCECEIRGQSPPAVPLYAQGGDWPFRVCGICRKAMLDDDDGQPMRIASEDAEAAGTSARPGCYMSCCECIALFRPHIARRLGRPEGMIRGNYLL
jgi:hypothetical protein